MIQRMHIVWEYPINTFWTANIYTGFVEDSIPNSDGARLELQVDPVTDSKEQFSMSEQPEIAVLSKNSLSG